MLTKQQLSEYRNDVIEKFVNIEYLMNSAISQKYFGRVRIDFVFPFLHSQHFSFALRIDVLKKLVKDFNKRMETKLRRMSNLRNYFVHISPNYFGPNDEITEDNVGYFPNPDKLEEKLDFEKLYTQFIELNTEVLPYIAKIFRELGGKLDGKK